jgi:hypothetical protein
VGIHLARRGVLLLHGSWGRGSCVLLLHCRARGSWGRGVGLWIGSVGELVDGSIVLLSHVMNSNILYTFSDALFLQEFLSRSCTCFVKILRFEEALKEKLMTT